jgi:hypothetical protein
MTAGKINQASNQVREVAPSPAKPTRRICRTPEEAFQAGWEAGADYPPLTPAQVAKVAALLGPSIRAHLAEKQHGSAA